LNHNNNNIPAGSKKSGPPILPSTTVSQNPRIDKVLDEGQCTPGLPDFSWYNIPKRGKIYQITIKYTKWPYNRPNGH
jgi:hypothetical protein